MSIYLVNYLVNFGFFSGATKPGLTKRKKESQLPQTNSIDLKIILLNRTSEAALQCGHVKWTGPTCTSGLLGVAVVGPLGNRLITFISH